MSNVKQIFDYFSAGSFSWYLHSRGKAHKCLPTEFNRRTNLTTYQKVHPCLNSKFRRCSGVTHSQIFYYLLTTVLKCYCSDSIYIQKRGYILDRNMNIKMTFRNTFGHFIDIPRKPYGPFKEKSFIRWMGLDGVIYKLGFHPSPSKNRRRTQSLL